MFYREETNLTFADVLLPLAVPRPYTYAVPKTMHVEIGQRVVVQLGKKKLYTGVVLQIHHNNPGHETKTILETFDEMPQVFAAQMDFWRWISTYYMCTMGEVMHAAMPAGLKLQSESKILPHPEMPTDLTHLKDGEYLLVEALENRDYLTIDDASKILEVINPIPTIKRLMDAGFLMLEEELEHQTKPKTHRLLSLARPYTDEEIVQLFISLKKSPKQSLALETFFKICEDLTLEQIPEAKLISEATINKTMVDALIDKGILQRHEILGDFETNDAPISLELSPNQQKALAEIDKGFADKKPVLLHGVTSSGKTELYISLIKKALTTHQRALYLVPEIALTTQLINRLKKHFGTQALVYHSRLSERERLAVYTQLISHPEPIVLLGARSALLLPLHDLGIIVADEEHDPSYKQQNPAPRYHARDCAIVLASMSHCPILLGSATPSIESYYNAQQGKYHLVELTERFGGVMMPEIEIHDLRKETFWKTMRGHFSSKLVENLEKTLGEGKKAILFQNRRGYTPIIQCTECGHAQKCQNCDITLTYHKLSNKLKCHYCGYQAPPAPSCGECGSKSLKEVGFGTEKIEEELATMLPTAIAARMDLDSTRKKDAYGKLIERFANGDLNVLIGTQMVTKGLDFEDVQLVAIMNADSLLHYPDFRAQERAYQLMEQVAGRAGRRSQRGIVAIQTYRPSHHIIEFVVNHAYTQMVAQQLEERQVFNYPPFCRLIHISLRHKDARVLSDAAAYFAAALRQMLAERVLGPEFPPVSRLRNVYHKNILIKLEKNLSAAKVKQMLLHAEQHVFTQAPYKSVRVVYDVDPY